MQQIVIGTAGHIDHGKTALVKALTGTNTDQLAQEKARGMTIDLGFAYLNEQITIIDVPGHEKFIRNMAAGAANVHIGMLVVAADDGIMPQTKEHLQILDSFSIQGGLVVLTKVDIVNDEEWIDLVELELQDLIKNTVLNGVPIIRVNNLTGDGIEAVKKHLLHIAKEVKIQIRSNEFRMHVDRVFTKKGFGTVVTGTVDSGELHVGDKLELLPNKVNTKVRGIQTHGGNVESVGVGDRAALNLANVERTEVYRGTVLSNPGIIAVTKKVIAHIIMYPNTDWIIKNNQRIRLHIGTAEIMGKVSMAIPKLKKGQNGSVIIGLEIPMSVAMDDLFVIRSYSPMKTIAQGRILDPLPSGKWSELKNNIKILSPDPEKRFHTMVLREWKQPRTLNSWRNRCFRKQNVIQQWINAAGLKIESKSKIVYSNNSLKMSDEAILSLVNNIYKRDSFRKTISNEAIIDQLKWSLVWVTFVLANMELEGKIIQSSGRISLSDYRPEITVKDQKDLDFIQGLVDSSGLEPISLKVLIQRSGFKPGRVNGMLHLLNDDNRSEKIGTDLWIAKKYRDEILKYVRGHFEKNKLLSVSNFKDIIGLTRKTAIPLLEYLDQSNYTQRDGNDRRIGSMLDA
ncbi:MAG: selenocysteine-specific translation elongation factor [Candidatus Neomarinimicrobiota bacterium]|nr:selenocysteine-specific translation elongation factor [Candidatus Neomarinimicrobiota bacterium]